MSYYDFCDECEHDGTELCEECEDGDLFEEKVYELDFDNDQPKCRKRKNVRRSVA